MEERLQKILAQAGFGSRRSCELLITAQRVRVNGIIAQLGSKADAEKDSISVDGQGIPRIAAHIYIALNKPRDVLSDIDPEDPRQTVHDLVKVPGHLFAVGRLDYDSEGLILMTNDGELANRLTHPRYGHEKEYHVLVGNRPDNEQLETWRRGVVLADGTRTRPAEVFVDGISGKGAWLRVVLREGRKRQIREVGARIGLPVLRILRVRIGTLLLGELRVGEWRYLTDDEVRRLKSTVEKPVRNLSARSYYGQSRSDRRLAPNSGEEARSGRGLAFGRGTDEGRPKQRSSAASKGGGDRSEWKPAPRPQARPQEDEERGEWRSEPHPKSSEDRPVRKFRGSGIAEHKPHPRANYTPDADRKSRVGQKPGGKYSARPENAPAASERKPRTRRKPDENFTVRPANAAPGSDHETRTMKKPGSNPAGHPFGGRPARHSSRPGGRPKGPHTPRR